MAHPFTKLFTKALSKSTQDNNVVYQTAKEIIERGYSYDEVAAVLTDMVRGRLDETECEIISNARTALVDDIADPSD